MTDHLPECDDFRIGARTAERECICARIANAELRGYRQGRDDGKATIHDCATHSAACCSASYRRGYADGLRATDNGDGTLTVHIKTYGDNFNQHGVGTNP